MKANWEKRTFQFKQPSGTSRGVLTEKHAWILRIWDEKNPSVVGIGECSVIPGLSPDFKSFKQYEEKLSEVCDNIELTEGLLDYPSLLFGVESAWLDWKNGGKTIYFDNDFSRGKQEVEINGLIWMGSESFMQRQIEEKIQAGFSTIKMKVGAIDFDTEFRLLEGLRKRFSSQEITIRVDANGAFSDAPLEKLTRLHSLEIHSIEQPIPAGNWGEMSKICLKSPLKIALDEELIGVNQHKQKIELLENIRPHYIVLKPSLHGGISGTKEWIELAETFEIPWWITSALESNIGLKTICQLVGEYSNPLPQGLGTGSLYTNNIPSNIRVENGKIFQE